MLLLRLAFCASLMVLVSPLLQADYASALKAYQNAEFEKAFGEFERLAKLGDVDAQRNLAAMYARGEFVARNWVDAFAWASVAALESSEATSIKNIASKKLQGEEITKANSLSEDYQARYARKVIQEQLFPVVEVHEAECTIENPVTPKLINKNDQPKYPPEALRAGLSAIATAEIVIDKQGVPVHTYIRDIQLNYADDGRIAKKMESLFATSITRHIRILRFDMSQVKQVIERPLKIVISYRVSGLENTVFSSNPAATNRQTEELRARASQEDGNAQYEFARQYDEDGAHFIAGQKSEIQAVRNQLYLRSAVNGSGAGQFRVAKRLLSGDQCEVDERKGLFWLTMAAQSGNPDAQFSLAWRLSKGESVAIDAAKSLFWLEQAANNGHKEAILRYALAQVSSGAISPDQFRQRVPSVEKASSFTFMELNAIAAAWLSDWDSALSLQQQVFDIATAAGFDLEHREKVLAELKQKQAPKFDQLF